MRERNCCLLLNFFFFFFLGDHGDGFFIGGLGGMIGDGIPNSKSKSNWCLLCLCPTGLYIVGIKVAKHSVLSDN